MGEWALGCAGNTDTHTPHLDRLAKEGARLTNHFSASAVCSPSRACLFTGKYSLDVGIPDFLISNGGVGLDPKHTTLAKVFKQNGYRTSLVGKWHLGDADRFHPHQHGYDHFAGFRIGGNEGPLSSKDPKIELNGALQQAYGYTSDILTDHAIDFIGQVSDKPFFLSLNFWAPHANQGVSTSDGDRTWHPLKEEDWSPFKDLDPVIPNPDFPKLDIPRVQRMTREYLGSVHSVDRNIGRVLQSLESRGDLNNTIVIFTSDNGFNIGHHGIWHKGNGWWILIDNQGDRPNLYDHSMRVPAIIRYPERVPGGQCIKTPNSSIDWFPTLLDYANIKAMPNWNLRGKSLTQILAGNKETEDRPIFGQYRMWDWNQTGADMRSWRTSKWKLMIDLKDTIPNELYDLTNDPDEKENLYYCDSARVCKARKTLTDKLRKHIKTVEAGI